MLLSKWCNLCSRKKHCTETEERSWFLRCWLFLSVCFSMLQVFSLLSENSLLLRTMDSTPHTRYMQLLWKFTSSTLNCFIGPAVKGMKANWLSSNCPPLAFSPCHFLTCFLLLSVSSTSSLLGSEDKPHEAGPGGGEQPPEHRQHPENGVSSQEGNRPKVDYPQEI